MSYYTMWRHMPALNISQGMHVNSLFQRCSVCQCHWTSWDSQICKDSGKSWGEQWKIFPFCSCILLCLQTEWFAHDYLCSTVICSCIHCICELPSDFFTRVYSSTKLWPELPFWPHQVSMQYECGWTCVFLPRFTPFNGCLTWFQESVRWCTRGNDSETHPSLAKYIYIHQMLGRMVAYTGDGQCPLQYHQTFCYNRRCRRTFQGEPPLFLE